MKKTRKECKTKQVKIMRYVFWRRVRHNYFTSFTISLNRKRWIISIKILILYENLITFSQSLRVLWIYAPLRKAEPFRKEEALYLRFFTQELKIRKFWISCCDYTGLIHSLYYTSVYHSVHTKYTGTLYLLIQARFMQQNCLNRGSTDFEPDQIASWQKYLGSYVSGIFLDES